MQKNSKWGQKYWADLAERVGTTICYGLITLLTTNSIVDMTWMLGWTIVGLPTALALLKGLLVNMGGEAPTASIVDVTSTGEAF